jgi:hypothetical protein
MHFVRFIISLFELSKRFATNIRASKRHSKNMLHAFEERFKGKFEPEISKEITSMQFFAHIFVMESFVKLNKRKSNQYEIDNNIIYFIIMILHDTLLDSKKLSIEEINAIVHHPEDFISNSFNESVLKEVLIQMQERVPDKKQYLEDVDKIQRAQIDSLRQFDPLTSMEDLIQIAKNKGGYTFYMYRHFMQIPFEKEIRDCLFQLGGLIQMTDDILDIHKDFIEGIRTFANSSSHYNNVLKVYDQQLLQLKNNIESLPVSKKEQRKIYFYMAIIASFGHIAIDNLKRLQAAHHTLPSISSIERKQWIIDMEKPKYIFKYIKQLYLDSRF